MKIKDIVAAAITQLRLQYKDGKGHYLESCMAVESAFECGLYWRANPAVKAWGAFNDEGGPNEPDWWGSCSGGELTQSDLDVRIAALEVWAAAHGEEEITWAQ